MSGAYISILRVKAFKSVGRQWLELPLERGLTCFLGKNGCGKSSLLQALCFAAACGPASLGAVHRLADLQNTECNEVCEVEFAVSKGSTVTWVKAALVNGTRAYKIGCKTKTGKEVKEFLREKGIILDQACSLIKQASVTALADSNCPTKIGQVVKDVSGLAHWNEEAAAAVTELKRTRDAIANISDNVRRLEKAVQADEASCAALVRLEEQNVQLMDLSQRLAAAIGACRSSAAHALAEAQLEADRLEVISLLDAADRESVSDQAHNMQRLTRSRMLQASSACLTFQLATKQSKLGEADASEATSCTAATAELERKIAGNEEEVMVLMERLAAARERAQALSEAERASVAARLDAKLAAAALQEGQDTLAKLQAAIDDWDGHDRKFGVLSSDIAAMEVRMIEAKKHADAAQRTAAETQASVAAAVAEITKLEMEHRQAQGKAAAARAELPAAVSAQAASVIARDSAQRELHAVTARLRHAEGALNRIAPHGAPAPVPYMMLHQCFRFRAAARELVATAMPALDIMAGDKLKVIVVETIEQAKAVLDWLAALPQNQQCRIWPVKALSVHDQTALLRNAQTRFPAGDVIMPVDLLEYQQAFQPALLRAFSMPVARTGEVAAALASRFRLASVTVEGRVSRPGSLQGGWRSGGTSASQCLMARKLGADMLQAEAAVLTGKLAEVSGDLAKRTDARTALEAAIALEEDSASALSQHQRDLAQLRARGLQEEQAARDAAHLAEAMAASLKQKHQLQETFRDAAGGCSAASTLDAHLERLRKDEKRLILNATTSTSKTEELEEAEERLRERVAGQDATEDLQCRLERAQDALHSSQQALRAMQAQAAMTAAEDAHQNAAAAQLRIDITDLQEKVAVTKRRHGEVEKAAREAQREADQAARAAEALAAEGPELAALLQRAALPADGLAAASSKEISRLQAERLKLKSAMRERRETLRTLKARAATLCQAVDVLDAGLVASRAQVEQANELAFEAIQRHFHALLRGLLPAHAVDLVKTGGMAADGVQFCPTPHVATADSEHERPVQMALGQLSGGERTLVALALMLAAAYAGAGQRLLLLDEVDAALDEPNQARVAALLQQLAGGSSATACQILAVTHNAAFHACGQLVQVCKDASGTHIRSTEDAAAHSKRAKAA